MDSVVGTPSGIALFLLTLITKSQRMYGPDFVSALTDAGRVWIGPKFVQLIKLLTNDLSPFRSGDFTERLGVGMYSSVWKLSNIYAVKAISLPPVAEHPVWLTPDPKKFDNDQFVRLN